MSWGFLVLWLLVPAAEELDKKRHIVFLPSASCHTSCNLAGLQPSIFVTPLLSNLFLLTPVLTFIHQAGELGGEAAKHGLGD